MAEDTVSKGPGVAIYALPAATLAGLQEMGRDRPGGAGELEMAIRNGLARSTSEAVKKRFA